jgi:hypothetical protein
MDGEHYSAFVVDVKETSDELKAAGVPAKIAREVASAASELDGPLSITVVVYPKEHTYSISKTQGDFGPNAAQQALSQADTDARIAELQDQVAQLLKRLDG